MIQFKEKNEEGKDVSFSMPTELVLFAMIELLTPDDREKLFTSVRQMANTSVVPTIKLS